MQEKRWGRTDRESPALVSTHTHTHTGHAGEISPRKLLNCLNVGYRSALVCVRPVPPQNYS